MIVWVIVGLAGWLVIVIAILLGLLRAAGMSSRASEEFERELASQDNDNQED